MSLAHRLRPMTHAVESSIDQFLGEHREKNLAELFEFLRIPSISARSEHTSDVGRAAEWVAAALRDAGLESKVHATAGHPVVVGEWRSDPGSPTVLIYGHYDVQPPE